MDKLPPTTTGTPGIRYRVCSGSYYDVQSSVESRPCCTQYALKKPGKSQGWSKYLELGLTASGSEGGKGRGRTVYSGQATAALYQV